MCLLEVFLLTVFLTSRFYFAINRWKGTEKLTEQIYVSVIQGFKVYVLVSTSVLNCGLFREINYVLLHFFHSKIVQ